MARFPAGGKAWNLGAPVFLRSHESSEPQICEGKPEAYFVFFFPGNLGRDKSVPWKVVARAYIKKEFPDSTAAAPVPPLGTRLIPALPEPGL